MAPRFQPKEDVLTRTAATLRQMDWFRGLRAAVALCAPIVLGDVAGIANLGWAGLGGFEAIVADAGGPYRTRLASLATLSLGGAAGLFIGSVTGTRLVWAIPVTLLFCFLWSYLAVLGQPFASAGILVQVIYICGLGAPAASWREALGHSLLLLAGGLWAALLSLFLWPLDAYRPARAAVSECYLELASFLGSIAELAGRPPQRAALWHRLGRHHQYRVRSAVEKGWEAVAAIRASRQSDTAQGHHLVVLLEHADLLIARTVALAEHMEAQISSEAQIGTDSSACQTITLDGFAELQAAERWIGSLLLRRRGQNAAAAWAVRQQMRQLPGALEDCFCSANATNRFFLAQVTEAAAELDTAIESAALLRLGKAVAEAGPPNRSASHFAYVYERIHQLRQGWHPTRIVDHLVANLTGKSLLLRHAVRVALVCSLDTAIIFVFRIDHGYWLLLTSLIVLQPHVSGTMRRGMERIGGTIGGGILAAILAALLHSQLAIAAALFPLALLALAFLPVNYTAFAFFLTPTFVLAWLPYSGDWQLALVRTANTIAGAVIALLAMLFLFPAYERDRAPQYLRASILADRRYLAQLSGAWRSHSRSSRPLANARRAAGLAHNDTEESLDRLLAENWPRRRPFAQFVAAFVTYLRRFAQSTTALAALDGEWAWKQSGPVQSRLELLDRRLAWLQDRIEDRIGAGGPAAAGGGAEFAAQFSSAPWPEPTVFEMQAPLPPLDHPGERLIERLERQAEVLHRQLNTLLQQGWLPS
jgi:uncharacterized membrane protein YccC